MGCIMSLVVAHIDRNLAALLPKAFPRARVLRFLGAGILNTGVGYALYAGFLMIGMFPQGALAMQFAIGVLWNFIIHGRFVFGVRGYSRLPRYAGAYLGTFLFNAALLQGFLLVMGPYMAQAVALGPTVILSYILVSRALGVVPHRRGEMA